MRTARILSDIRTGRAALAAALALAVGSAACRSEPETATAAAVSDAARPNATAAIGALGHIEAGDGIARIAARSLSGQASIVKVLYVKEGDTVKAGQEVAELDSRDQLAATERQAAARVEVAKRRLAQVQAGPKPADVAAQQADIARLESQLTNAQSELARYEKLGENVTAVELDRLRYQVTAADKAVVASRERLTSMRDIRGVDVELAQAELEEAIRNHARARAEHDASICRAPIDGRVIRIHARPGEQVGSEGLMEVAPAEPMYVVAEVSESDIARVKTGQKARITAEGLAAPVSGKVERVSLKVLQNQLMPTDPANFSDGRVVNTWIRVDDPRTVANLINLRVNVVIEP
jgi:HlyD family secretion protein